MPHLFSASNDNRPLAKNGLVSAMIEKYTLGNNYKAPMMAELATELQPFGLNAARREAFLRDTLTDFAKKIVAESPSTGIDSISRDSIIAAVNNAVHELKAEKSVSRSI